MPNPKCGPFDLKNLWQDSLRRALFARATGKLLGMKEAEEPFSAALLQDMAIPLLAKEAPAAYNKLLDSRKDGAVRLSALERRVFGWTHAEAGAMIARQWNLPDEFAVLIEGHLDLEDRLQEAVKEPAMIGVGLSALLPATSDSQWYDAERFIASFEQAVGPSGPTSAEILAQVDDEFTEFAPVLKLASPSKSLVQILEEATAPSA